MIAGFYGNNMDIPMSGIDVSRPGDVQQDIVHKLAQATLIISAQASSCPGTRSSAMATTISPDIPCPTTVWWKP